MTWGNHGPKTHRTKAVQAMGIQGQGTSEGAKGAKGWWEEVLQGKCSLGSALFSGGGWRHSPFSSHFCLLFLGSKSQAGTIGFKT